jgi:single stranded DNA-binding protein
MSDINKTTLTGRLVRDPIIRNGSTGTLVGFFTLASNSSYKRKNGEPEKETAFIGCKVFGAWAEPLTRHKKGAMAVAHGRLKTEKWEKDGRAHSELVLICESLFFLAASPGAKGNDEVPIPQVPPTTGTPDSDGPPF